MRSEKSSIFAFFFGVIATNFVYYIIDEMPSVDPEMQIARLTRELSTSPTRDVHVGTMCRCGNKGLPIKGQFEEKGQDTHIVQLPSKATGEHSKRFIMHKSEECTCIENSDLVEETHDLFLSNLDGLCHPPHSNPNPSNYTWEQMPEFGVEENLPLFMGVLSYKSPLSLEASLDNWLQGDLFNKAKVQDIFVQLNHRSDEDDRVVNDFQKKLPEEQLFTPLGSPEENHHPGLTIANFCRRAEAHPNSHPDGNNLLMFLEKDWHLTYHGKHVATKVFQSINALAQRGVPFIRLMQPLWEVRQLARLNWKCPAKGVEWRCTLSNQQRWANLPAVIDCKWFLRYFEPFALMEDSIMYGCKLGFQEKGYFDWEEAFMDGRVAWSEAQWVIANTPQNMFGHIEIDK